MAEGFSFTEVAAVTAIFATILSGAWVLVRLAISHRHERTQLCLKLHEEFFTDAMLNARHAAWFALSQENQNRPFLWSEFFTTEKRAESAFDTY